MTQAPFDDELRRAFDALAERLQRDLNEQLTTIAEQLSTSMQAEREQAATQAAEEARAAATGEVDARLAELAAQETAAREQGRSEGLEHARASMTAANAAASRRLIDGIRAIDEARSLSEILDTLVSYAGGAAARAGILIVRDNALRGWRFVGFGSGLDAAAQVEVPVDAGGIIADAVRSETAAMSEAASAAPEFAALPDGRRMQAIPVLLAGKVIAVLYADEGLEGDTDRQAWPAAVEVLTRHAARALEAITALKAAQAITGQPGVGREHGVEHGGRAASANEDDDAAKRYARLLISEIKLYHEPDVIAGRRERDLGSRLGGEIARARVLYDQRVPARGAGAVDYFHDELVRTLADGDASLV
jgi:hypothetical protein